MSTTTPPETQRPQRPIPPLTAEQLDARMAHADSVLSDAGHQVDDPATREVMRRYLAQELTLFDALAEIKAARVSTTPTGVPS